MLNSMYRSGLVNTLGTHANTKGFGLTSLSGVRRGFMPPQLKTKQTNFCIMSKLERNRGSSFKSALADAVMTYVRTHTCAFAAADPHHKISTMLLQGAFTFDIPTRHFMMMVNFS